MVVSNDSNEVKLIIRGDDMGMTHGSVVGFERSLNQGVMTCASMQPVGPWFEAATQVAKNNPQWCTGVHLTLIGEWIGCPWRPVLPWDKVSSLVDDNGYLFRYPDQLWQNKPKLKEIEAEFRAQIELTLKMGVPVYYIDTHYISLSKDNGRFPGLFELVQKVAADYDVPVSALYDEKRVSSLVGRPGVSYIDDLPISERKKALFDMLDKLTPGIWLWASHPGIKSPEQDALVHTSLADRVTDGFGIGAHRAAATELLTDPEVKAKIKEKKIKLTNYRELTGK
ncbi:MAG TPA: ChbG/HpnK family deacetylase [Sedimentisphaerales bacterium]|nr:ChbG/HpnK family deacetylase [Sedimentisphaerales bacterium]